MIREPNGKSRTRTSADWVTEISSLSEPAGDGQNELGESRMTIAPLPRISIQAFCETPDLATSVEDASGDRRMMKAHVKVQMGGAEGAIEAFSNAPTPNVIIIENRGAKDALIQRLDELAELCDPGTKVVIIGHQNDIALYRDLVARGVSDYLVAPVKPVDLVEALSNLYHDPVSEPVGRMIAVVGAKGGVGASTIAHNLAWALARETDMSTVLADMDCAFGTAGLDFNQDPPQGIAEAVFSPDRLDANLLDRLLSKCTDKLSILAAPATLDRQYDFDETSFDQLLDLLRQTTPITVLDVPHVWNAWTRRVLIAADEVVIVAAPDLAGLRNAKNVFDTLRASRPNDKPPRLVLNMTGVPKRPEIATADFEKALEVQAAGVVPFDPKLFGTAANNGQMLAEVDRKSKITETVDSIASELLGRSETRSSKKRNPLQLLSRFRKR